MKDNLKSFIQNNKEVIELALQVFCARSMIAHRVFLYQDK